MMTDERRTEICKQEVQDSASVVILADVSGSMRGEKILRLKRELSRLWPEITARLLAFAYDAKWCDGPDDLPDVGGGTDMRRAFEVAATVWPSEVIVISDGRPQDEAGALIAVQLIPGTISVLFVGGDEDLAGADFMRRLAALGGGMFAHRDLAKNLSIGGELREMLALPAPISL